MFEVRENIGIEQLAEHAKFPEVAWLLINGELPTKEQLERYARSISCHTK